MARPRQFEEAEVLERAMSQFWKAGFGATSVSDLEQATGLPRVSLYNAFGDKSALFRASLERYQQMAFDFFENDAFKDGGLSSIETLFRNLAKRRPKDAPEHYGCLMLNTVLDSDSVAPDALMIVDVCRTQMVEGFAKALRTASEQGAAIATERTIKDRAEFLVSAMWGARMTARLRRDVTAGRGTTRTVLAAIDGWRSVTN